MGKTTNHLLVSIITSWLLFCHLPCFAKVNAKDYDAFWLWGGVRSQPVLDQAKTIYLLQGQIVSNYNGETHFIKQGNPIKSLNNQNLWIVYRAHTLNWTEDTFHILTKQLKQWRSNNIKVKGIQIDFDVATNKLPEYITFLTQVRQQLPNNYQLSITGLLDWGSNTDPSTINQLTPIINEVIFQTYQGRQTISDYQQYLKKLQTITIPFKIGIIQYGEWQRPTYLEKNPNFKGYVVFLQNSN